MTGVRAQPGQINKINERIYWLAKALSAHQIVFFSTLYKENFDEMNLINETE